MKLERLQIDGLRCLQDVDVRPGPHLNVLLGPNGAGKTSFLEAAFLLSHGRSFRQGPRDVVVRRGGKSMRVYGEVRDQHNQLHRLGLGRERERWDVHMDGESGARLSDLLQLCAVVCFEPGSHALIGGGAEERRQFMDWGVFHVEHRFLSLWRGFKRALKQRNALLRNPQAPSAALLEPWEAELDLTATQIDICRKHYLQRLDESLQHVCADLLPELGSIKLDYRRGWDPARSLSDVLRGNRERDLSRGHTTSGVHRADWQLVFEHAPQREHLSRGQEKLCALACLLAQASLYADQCGEWPIICLDDLGSELDAEHQAAVLAWLPTTEAQIFITGTQRLPQVESPGLCMFHVEHGQINQREDFP